jgi:hypothetical protein
MPQHPAVVPEVHDGVQDAVIRRLHCEIEHLGDAGDAGDAAADQRADGGRRRLHRLREQNVDRGHRAAGGVLVEEAGELLHLWGLGHAPMIPRTGMP